VLRRKRQLSRDASLLLIYLRKEYTYSDDEDGSVVVSQSQIEEFLRTYREEGDGDGAKFDRRVAAAIQALDELSLLRADQDVTYLYIVSPAVVPLIGPDELLRFRGGLPAGRRFRSTVQGGIVSDGQFRITQVQLLNWGGYCGLQTMPVRRAGTAILGPSGRGKSTMLDGLASVIMPNPQEFNHAVRDDKGAKRERTVYSYARGLTDRRRGEDKRSGTTTYLPATWHRRVPQRYRNHLGS
jgi:hypothetical protein